MTQVPGQGAGDADELADETVSWTVPIHEAVQLRPRNLLVEVVETRVTLMHYGHAFVVPHGSIAQLRAALAAADSVAEHRKRGYHHES
jgi:hypothetical protein